MEGGHQGFLSNVALRIWVSGGKRRWTCVLLSCFLSALVSQANPPLSSIFPHYYSFKWTSCGPSFQSHERTLGDNWAGQTCHSCKKEAFVWPWKDIFRVAFCFGGIELDVGFPLTLPLSMGPITWHVSSCLHPCSRTSYFLYYCQVAS